MSTPCPLTADRTLLALTEPSLSTPASAPHALGVARSFAGRPWSFRIEDERSILALAQASGLEPVLARILLGRGIGIESVERFLAPSLRGDLPDPLTLAGMGEAVARIATAVEGGETIAVFGDYDVDGATSSALLGRYLGALGCPPRLYIPDRQREGYGPNSRAFEILATEGARLVITVDCGTLAYAPLERAVDLGLDVIVLDHHQAEPRLPQAVAVVNPNRLDDTSDLGSLAAVGVTFMTLIALNRVLRERGVFSDRTEPDLIALLDLVALGTVADVMPLKGLNRTFVAQGLKVLARRGNPGLTALMDVARIESAPNAYHLGFLLGPRVNAGGRVGEAELGATLLTTDDGVVAETVARSLDGYNRDRQEIEANVETAAIALVEARLAGGNGPGPVLLVAGEGWHPGVIGIVASRLKERYHRPTFVLSVDGARAKGSGRSLPGVDLGAAVSAARTAGLLLEGGGHAMAAGITVESARIEELEAWWANRLEEQVACSVARDGLMVDAALGVNAINFDLAARLQRLAPFGTGNAEPRFVLPGVIIAYAAPMGHGHLRLAIADGGGRRVNGVAFRSHHGALIEELQAAAGTRTHLHLAGHLRADSYRGREQLRFIVEDAAEAAFD